jgi:1A family penicillin-binding protein
LGWFILLLGLVILEGMRLYNIRQEKPNRITTSRSRRGNVFSLILGFYNRNKKSLWKYTFRGAALFVALMAITFIYITKDLPDPANLQNRSITESTKIFSRNGELLYEVHGEVKRTQVKLSEMSAFIPKATVAIEDKDFYEHSGISIKGILRALWKDLLSLDKSQGGSTIVQQFVKKAILSDEKAWTRKIKEIVLSLEINARFSKDEILNMYLNEIPYGRNSYGVEAASQSYYGKSAKDLTLAESAYLAALPQAPSRYKPDGPNRELLDGRKDTILKAMREQGYITEQQETEAKAATVTFQPTHTAIHAPHFVLYVQDYLADKYGERTLEEGGFKVYTTLDLRLQTIAEKVVKEGVEKSVGRNKNNNAALVAMDPRTGQILAMVGSKDYFGTSEPAGCAPRKCLFDPNVNVSTSPRQPGSSIKPLVYVTAFGPEFKMSPATMLMDVITNFGTYGGQSYIPRNYNGNENGPLPIRKALAGSLNVPAVKTLALIGVDNAIDTLRTLGYTTPLSDCGLSLVLGGCEVKLLDHVSGYASLAAGGIRRDKTSILRIEDRNGKTLEEYKENGEQVIDAQAAYLVTNIMTDNASRSFVFGNSTLLTLPGRPVAAKTGTTQKWRDGWALGFTPSLAAGVWTGNNNGEFMRQGADSIVVAAPMWNQFMKEALEGTPVEQFSIPKGIQHITVDAVSGKLPTNATPETKTEVFASYSVPTETDPVHIVVNVDTRTGEAATADTPLEFVQPRSFTVFHSERPDNPSWEEAVQKWAKEHGYNNAPIGGEPINPDPSMGDLHIEFTEPSDGATITTSPFKVVLEASSVVGISQVELLIDGEVYQSANIAPFTFSVNKKLSEGSHTLAARVTDKAGATSQATTEIKVLSGDFFSITEPTNGAISKLPIDLVVKSAQQLENVSLYAQRGNELIYLGNASIASISDGYEYSFTWTGNAQPGIYRIYAGNSTGLQTSKITITIPK